MTEAETIEIEYHACSVCGHEPAETIPPKYVLSLDPDDRDEETIMSKPFGGSLSVPFACSDECFVEWTANAGESDQ